MMRNVILSLLLVVGCVQRPPSPDNAFYVVLITPLLDDNALLAERLLTAAAAVHKAPDTPGAALEAWRDEVVPLAHHLHEQASMVQPPGSWAVEHDRIIGTWAARAAGYQLILEAAERGDEARLKRGRALADKAKLDEESWMQDVNARLAADGLHLRQYR